MVKLFWKNSNLYDHDTSMSQTDYFAIAMPASRGKKVTSGIDYVKMKPLAQLRYSNTLSYVLL